MRHKTQAQSERFLQHKTRATSVLNDLKNDSFYTHLVRPLLKNFQYRCCISREI